MGVRVGVRVGVRGGVRVGVRLVSSKHIFNLFISGSNSHHYSRPSGI